MPGPPRLARLWSRSLPWARGSSPGDRHTRNGARSSRDRDVGVTSPGERIAGGACVGMLVGCLRVCSRGIGVVLM